MKDTLAIGPYMTAAHVDFRRKVKSALATIILPYADDWEERGGVPRQAWRQLADAGLLAVGHSGEEFLRSAIFLEELGRTGYAGIRAAIGVHAYMASSYLELFGGPEQRDRYLGAAHDGRRIGALAITESSAGSDLRDIRTRTHSTDDGSCRVSGEKVHIVNGSSADFIITLVKTGDARVGAGLVGTQFVIIDAHTPGVKRIPEGMVGWRSADISRIEFTDVLIPQESFLGRPGRTLMQIMGTFGFERIVAGLLALGGAGYCLSLLKDFVRGHRVSGLPLSGHGAVRQVVADLEIEYEIVRQYAYKAAWLQSQGRLDGRTAMITKLKATELEVSAAQNCLRYYGARGYVEKSVPARLYRDSIGGTIAGGANSFLREMIFAHDFVA